MNKNKESIYLKLLKCVTTNWNELSTHELMNVITISLKHSDIHMKGISVFTKDGHRFIEFETMDRPFTTVFNSYRFLDTQFTPELAMLGIVMLS